MLDVTRELDALYGSHALGTRGVIHPVHAARGEAGRLHALRIDAQTPRSETDFFVLSLCRARADAVLTSAENLRREPKLSHALSGPWAPVLHAYRREELGKGALACAILTRTGDVPLDHPVWDDGTHKLLLAPPALVSGLRGRIGRRAEVVAFDDADAADACALLHARGLALISVEAGPHSAAALYARHAVDELWLTVFQRGTEAPALAGALPPDAVLFAGLSLVGASERSEHGLGFRFELWRRPS